MKNFLFNFGVLVNPMQSFEYLKQSNSKKLIAFASILTTMLILNGIQNYNYLNLGVLSRSLMENIYYSFGFIIRIGLVALLMGIIINKMENKKLDFIANFAILSVSALPIILGPLIFLITNNWIPGTYWLGEVLFGILVALGIKEFYSLTFLKSLLISLGLLLFSKLIEVTFFGINANIEQLNY
jgi:hypothetical protein